MDKLVLTLKKPAKLLLLIFVGVYALFELLHAIGIMATGALDGVFGGLFFLVAFGGLVAALIVALIKKNDNAARLVGLAYFGFLAVRTIYGFLNGDIYGTELGQAVLAFDILAALAGVTIFAFVILGAFSDKIKNNKTLDLVALCLLFGYICLSFLARILEFGVFGQFAHDYDYKFPWYVIVGTIADLVLLGAILFGYLLLFVKTPEAAEAPANADSGKEQVFEAEAVQEQSAESEAEAELVEPVVEAEVEVEPAEAAPAEPAEAPAETEVDPVVDVEPVASFDAQVER